jgi:hypothetical protein
LLQGVGSIQAEAAPALCGTAEAVPFVRSLSSSAEVVPFVLHFSTPTWFRNPGSQHELVSWTLVRTSPDLSTALPW